MSLCFAQVGFRVRRLVLGGAVFTAVALAFPGASNASACGIQYFGTHQFNGYTIPSGQLTHCISGKGYHVSWDGANFASAGNLCDASIEFTYGYGRRHLKSSIHRGCSHVGQWKYALNTHEPRGTACARLYVYIWRKYIAQQCHFIY